MTFIDPDSEGALEVNTIRLTESLGWEFANCYHEICGENSTLGRETTEQVVLEWRLKAALEKLNPDVPPFALDLALDELTKDRSVLSSVRANQEVHKLLKDGIRVTYRTSDYLIDFSGGLIAATLGTGLNMCRLSCAQKYRRTMA